MSRDRILVVDDDIDVLESLQDELALSFNVDAVSSGAEAIARLNAEHYDAVVADLRMPEIGGIAVLEAARRKNPETVRIILTGHLDEEARTATLGPNAPFKIGKPWHDALDVTLRRAFEHRERMRQMEGSFGTLLASADADDHFAAATGMVELARALIERVRKLDGVLAVRVVVRAESDGVSQGERGAEPEEQILASHGNACDESDWHLDLPLSVDGQVRVLASGKGQAHRQAIVTYLVQRAARWCGLLTAPVSFEELLRDPAGRLQLYALHRRATIGALAASITHELASLVQNIQLCLSDLAPAVCASGDADLQDSLMGAQESSECLVTLHRTLREFVHAGEPQLRPCRVADVVARAVSLCSVETRRRRWIQVLPLPDVEILGDPTLLVQALVNLLRNAAEATAQPGAIEIRVLHHAHSVEIMVVDDGPGVPPELKPHLFTPFASCKGAGAGLGLAIAAQIARDHQGSLAYCRSPMQGACFSLTLPLYARPGC